MNPQHEWRLSPAERRALDAQIEHMNYKIAADALGLSSRTVSVQLGRARDKMGARNQLEAVLQWDRYRRQA